MTLTRLRSLVLPPRIPNPLGILFVTTFAVIGPLVAADLIEKRDYDAVFAPFYSGVISDAHIQALWHLAFMMPLFCSLWMFWMRSEALEHAVAWTTPGYLRRYLRIEYCAWLGSAAAVALPQLILQGPVHAFATFSIVLLAFYTLHPTRRRTDVGWFTKTLGALLAAGIVAPGILGPWLQAQPLIIGVAAAATVWFLRVHNGMAGVARGAALEGLGIDNVVDRVVPGSVKIDKDTNRLESITIETTETVSEAPPDEAASQATDAPAGVSASKGVDDDAVTRWKYTLWRAPLINWIRAAHHESWVTRLNRRFPYEWHLLFWTAVFVWGMQGWATAMAVGWLVSSRGILLHLPAMYPLHRRGRAKVHSLLLLVNAAFVLCVMLVAYGLSTALRILFGADPLPFDPPKGVAGLMAIVLSFIPFMHWPRRLKVSADVLTYAETQFPNWKVMVLWIALAGFLSVKMLDDSKQGSTASPWPMVIGALLLLYSGFWLFCRWHFANRDI